MLVEGSRPTLQCWWTPIIYSHAENWQIWGKCSEVCKVDAEKSEFKEFKYICDQRHLPLWKHQSLHVVVPRILHAPTINPSSVASLTPCTQTDAPFPSLQLECESCLSLSTGCIHFPIISSLKAGIMTFILSNYKSQFLAQYLVHPRHTPPTTVTC